MTAAAGHAVVRRPDGTILVTATATLGPYPSCFTEHLVAHARAVPDRAFLTRRNAGGGGREVLTYGEALRRVRRIGAALLRRDLGPERPLAILSGNGFEHALLTLAALHVGIPVAPVSPAYSTVSGDHARLREMLALLTPGLVFADDGQRYGEAIGRAVPPGTEIVLLDPDALPRRQATAFSDLADGDEIAVEAAHRRIEAGTVAKYLFTSGSTGVPKAVITTHGMLASNQAMLLGRFPFLRDEPPILVDWLPWHHVFGGNHNLGLVLANGGTLHIDDGRPLPAAIGETVRILKEIAPTTYITVPRGFEALLPHLATDPELRSRFFSRLRFTFFAAAGLPQPVWDGLDRLAQDTIGRTVPMLTGLGSTETAPFALVTGDRPARSGDVGLPASGLTLKLAPVAGKLEARLKGPSVTPGYWRRPDLTGAAFDEEGFYRLGDALLPVDPADPGAGLRFDGRLNEDFKLTTGTWCSVGPLRAAALDAFAPLVRDIAIAGEARSSVAGLVFPDLAACRAIAPDASEGDLLTDERVRRAFATRLATLVASATGSSNRLDRVLLLAEPPSLDRDEVTDKGSINQRAVLRVRADAIERLYAEPPGPDVILPEHR